MIKSLLDSSLYNFLGWKRIKDSIKDTLSSNKRILVLYPHTNWMDLVSLLLYMNTDDFLIKNKHRMVVPIKDFSKKYEYIEYFKKNSDIKFINIDNPDKKSNNNMEKIISELENMDEWIFLISPKATSGKEWRTGWCHIAKNFDVPIMVCGPDFNTQEMKFLDELVYVNDKNYEEVKEEVKNKYNQIVPYYPNRDPSVKYRNHNYISIISLRNLISMIIIVLIIIFCFVFAAFSQKEKWKPNISIITKGRKNSGSHL